MRIEVSSGCFEAGFPADGLRERVRHASARPYRGRRGRATSSLTALQKEEHPRARVLRQPSGQDTARRTAAHNVSSL